ncbi:uncharacterized protein KY384_009274 [Bacidia gigantensis]|uniref:uncharacterized protein n=1 Tax=Bacidia gigantensis TaxID=2732470 RepID=UPI001D0394F9|nr:uncharacterized protein KY384_009274 [Bacidia gigantensis]KAG8525630.1 hypothetical protein KY384_009274 [Bacidia gigantensis]
MSLGQTNQLVVLGFVLSLMSFCSLSASYKVFSGGATEREVKAPGMDFGMTAAPGYQLIGNGLSLLPNVYLPFWLHPALNRTYGFNLFVADNDTSAILDAPLPGTLVKLQSSLELYQSATLEVDVNTTVTERINPSPAQRADNNFWTETNDTYPNPINSPGPGGKTPYEIWSGQGKDGNIFNETYLSRWDPASGQTFASQAERFITTRRTCTGTWNVTRTNATLIGVRNLIRADQAINDQLVIQKNALEIGTIFNQFLGEFDYTARGRYNQRLPDSTLAEPVFVPKINTRSPLVAAMIWARIVSLDGPERPTHENNVGPVDYHLSYPKRSDQIEMVRRVLTLKRSRWLVVILVIHPVLTILALAAKLTLFGTPISDDFGVVSLLAALGEDEIRKLQGAALSGQLSKTMRVRFVVNGRGADATYDQLQIELDSKEPSDRLTKRMLYG